MTSAAKLFEGRSSRPLSSLLHGSSNLSSNLMLPRSETKFKRKLPRSETKFKRKRCASSRCNVV